jgi:hypothetical protein
MESNGHSVILKNVGVNSGGAEGAGALASRLSPLASRLSPLASRLSPLASRLSPLASYVVSKI